MKQFRCGDVVPGCSAEFQAVADAEILAAVAAHARTDHGMPEVPDWLAEQVRGAIRDTPEARSR